MLPGEQRGLVLVGGRVLDVVGGGVGGVIGERGGHGEGEAGRDGEGEADDQEEIRLERERAGPLDALGDVRAGPLLRGRGRRRRWAPSRMTSAMNG